MSIRELLVTFVTSEEASIAQRSFFHVGAMLTGVVLVAMVIVGLTSQPAWAEWRCTAEGDYCPGGQCGSWSREPCNPNCEKVWRSCFGGCYEYYYDCAGGPQCSASCT